LLSGKYKEIAEKIRKKLDCTTAEVLPIMMGSSGIMPRKTVENLKRLGLRDQDMMMVPMLALRSSIEIANIFYISITIE